MPECSTMRHTSKIFSLWGYAQMTFALASQAEREELRREGFLLIKGGKCFGSDQSCCVSSHKAGEEGQLCVLKDKQPVHQLSWCLSRVSTAVCRWLLESITEIPARGGGPCLLPLFPWSCCGGKAGLSTWQSHSSQIYSMVTLCSPKNMGPSPAAGPMYCY